MEVKPIAYIHNDFVSKFGIPRQSLLVGATSRIVFEEEYRFPEAVRGLEGYSHLWILWEFSENKKCTWHPTVRPPRLGGNERMGVFATRSPFRPNSIGLSCVEILSVTVDSEVGPVITVKGADLMNGTPILDLKPYLPYADAHPEATGGFAEQDAVKNRRLRVEISEACSKEIQEKFGQSTEKLETLKEILAQDPRPAYQDDPDRVYGMKYGELEVKFQVKDGILRVISMEDRRF